MYGKRKRKTWKKEYKVLKEVKRERERLLLKNVRLSIQDRITW